jgi:hypothetical protein
MRRTTTLPALVAAVLMSLGAASPADAMPAPRLTAKAEPTCQTAVVGVDADKHVRVYTVRNNDVTNSKRSGKALPSRVTAWGFYDSADTKLGYLERLNAVTANGTPRRVTLGFKDGSDNISISSTKYDQDGFEPRLFADGHGYFAYTVNGAGKLQRWVLTRYRNGDIRFAQKVRIGGGYGDLKALQASGTFKHNGSYREYLYATTAAGALQQIAVPLKKPTREKRRTLLSSGYAGFTELSWSYCNGDATHVSLIAVDPTAETATWTTVKNSVKRPVAKLRGEITGGDRWDLSAVL